MTSSAADQKTSPSGQPPYTLGPTFTRPLSMLNPLDYMRLLYWVFFHPQWVRKYVEWIAPNYPDKPRPVETWEFLNINVKIRALVIQSFLLTVILPLAILFLIEMADVPVTYGYAAIGVVGGLALGIASGVAGGVAIGATVGVAGGLTFGVAGGMMGGVAGGVMPGVVIGLTFGLMVSVASKAGGLSFEIVAILAAGVPYGMAFGLTLGLIKGAAIGKAFGFSFIVTYFLALCRIPLYLLGLILGIDRKKRQPHPGVKVDGTLWLPFPGIRREIAESLHASPHLGVALCDEYLNYSLQFIPAIQALTEVLSKDSAISHSLYRLLLMSNRFDLLKYGTIALRNVLWENFLLGLFIIPRRRLDSWYSTSPRLDSPDRAIFAGYHYIIDSILPTVAPIERILTNIDNSIEHFQLAAHVQHSYEAINSYAILRDCLACETAGEIAALAIKPAIPLAGMNKGSGNFSWLDFLPEEELRPELLYTLRELRSATGEVMSLTGITSLSGRLSAAARANDALRGLNKYAARECFNPEKTLLKLICERWMDIITRAGGEVGRSAAPVDIIPNNYIVGPALQGQQGRLFVGRDDIYRDLLRLWSNDRVKQPVVFYGQRRMGKTSILLHMETNLDAEYIPVFLDMQTLATVDSHGAFLYNLADKTASELNKMGLALAIPTRSDYADEPFIAFRKFIEAAEAAVPPNKWVVLMIDEFELVEDKFKAGKFPGDLMLQFRNIMQHHPRLALVMAGSHHLDEMRRDYWGPLLGIACVIKVGYLSREASIELITNPWDDFPLEYRPETIEKIIQSTCGQPLLIQAIASGILERVNKRLTRGGPEISPVATLEDAEAEIENTLAANEYFQAVCGALPPEARLLLKALAAVQSQPGQWVRVADIEINMKEKDKLAALEILKRRDMIDVKDDMIRFTVELVRRFLEKASRWKWSTDYTDYTNF